ncbi:MAG: CBS domain-containing protein [Anaerolineales bacterium]|uniref:CBS domain-containing protein n=1 Tax=Promineifilum sp. TaxID=2664178 RepID=UPI001DCA8D93|nr:CBS domain-containing protein [Anaerolineales bacterium]MCB8936460.1 CBS domain-containing protein [Promineifilum sp.]MCO5178591.1 CBS domain-containing protein [Promineifilum sp.]
MKVRNILATKKGHLITIDAEQPVRKAIAMLVDNRIGALLVMDSTGKLAGILSERDIMRTAATDEALFDRPVTDIMTREVVVGMPQDDVIAVAHTMLEKRFRHLPIMDEGQLIGIISIGDVLKIQRDAYRGEVDTLETRIIAKGEE